MKQLQENKWDKVFYWILGLLIISWFYVGIKQGLGNQQAAEKGLCIKARPSAIMFRSTTYTIDVVYQYKGEKYRGEVFTTVKSRADSIRQKPDSIWIKILPENPRYLTWCEQR